MPSAESPKPDLVHIVLPPYEVPDLIVTGGVVVENRGNAPAKNVKVVLEYSGANSGIIRHLQVLSDVEYILLGGGDQFSFATIRARQLGAGQRIVIYYSAPGQIQPRVKVSHYEG